MIFYLDTSALIKLYIHEEGSELINTITADNAAPLPVWDLHMIEFHNALKLKVFRDELKEKEAIHLCTLFKTRKKAGIYYTPEMDRKEHADLCIAYTDFSAELGCRSLDIMHIAAAVLFKADRFITCDSRQSALGDRAGLQVTMIKDM